jgi:hypothetical protein
MKAMNLGTRRTDMTGGFELIYPFTRAALETMLARGMETGTLYRFFHLQSIV